MSFTYAQLKQVIQDYTENSEPSFVTNLPVFIRQAEERILKSVQLSLFRKNATGVTTASNKFLAMPTDYLAPFSLSLSIPNRIARTNGNLSTPLIRAATGIEPEATLFNVVVNGRRIGDIDNSGNPVNSQDSVLALQWENGVSSAAVTAYILGPMNTYISANRAAYAAIGMVFDAETAVKSFVEFKEPSFLQSYTPSSDSTGLPRYYGVFDVNNFLLSPTPNDTYEAELHYLYRPASITAGSEGSTTWLSENAELSLLYAALVEAYVYMKGEADMMALYDKRFQESLVGLKLLGEARETTQEYRVGQIVREKQ
tara:strand:- start:102 stop:1040 length:939 start_codon:yes stop_codon:yes gene_type:complete